MKFASKPFRVFRVFRGYFIRGGGVGAGGLNRAILYSVAKFCQSVAMMFYNRSICRGLFQPSSRLALSVATAAALGVISLTNASAGPRPLHTEGTEQPPLSLASSNAPLKKIEAGVFELGAVRLDKNKKTLRFPATVNMNQGLVEYFLVNIKGKVHESVLKTEAEPYHLHLAKLLIEQTGTERIAGASSRSNETLSPALSLLQREREKLRSDSTQSLNGESSSHAGTNSLPPSEEERVRARGHIESTNTADASNRTGGEADRDSVTISVSWQSADGEKECRAEDLVFNLSSKSPMSRGDWIYTGSRVLNGTFIAQRDGSIVSVIADPDALINNPRPGRENDQIWQANATNAPPLNTSVQVTIQFERR